MTSPLDRLRGSAPPTQVKENGAARLTSRHRHACVVVARAGIPELLDSYPPAEPVHLGVPVKFPDGWEAHQAIMAHLARHRAPAP